MEIKIPRDEKNYAEWDNKGRVMQLLIKVSRKFADDGKFSMPVKCMQLKNDLNIFSSS